MSLNTTITNSKVVHSYTITINIHIVSNIEKFVRDNLISLFSVQYYKSIDLPFLFSIYLDELFFI